MKTIATTAVLVISGVSGAVCTSIAVGAGEAGGPPSYHAIVLPQIDDTDSEFKLTFTVPFAVNDDQQVTGSLGNQLGFVWSASGGSAFLQPMIGPTADAAVGTGINSNGLIGGSYTPAGGFLLKPFSLTEAGVFTALETVEPDLAGGAADVNDNGWIVGSVETDHGGTFGGPTDSCYWIGATLTQIGGFGGQTSDAVAINENNVIVGASNTQTQLALRPFRWTQAGGLQQLPQLVTGVPATPADINDNGLIVGRGGVSLFQNTAVYWSPEDDSIHPLDSLYVDPVDIGALSVNNDGLIVGHGSNPKLFRPEARLWFELQPYDLNELVVDLPEGIHLERAVEINENGDIAVEASTTVDGQIQLLTVILTPIAPCSADIAAEGGGAGSDGSVNVFDLVLLLDNWGTAGAGANIADPSSIVDVFDLTDLLTAWGSCDT